jgi:hypothetical protein
MNPIKKMIVQETVKVLREENKKRKIKKAAGNLFEAVKTASSLKDNSKKKRIAEKIVKIAENKLIREFHEEGEDRMLKAQLLSIMENAKKLYHMIGEDEQLEDWIQSKITIAEDYLRATYGYMKYYNGVEDMEHEVDDEMEWDEVEEEDFDDMGDVEYDDEDAWDETDIDDFDDLEYEDEDYMEDEDSDFMQPNSPTI